MAKKSVLDAPTVGHGHWAVLLLRISIGWLFTYAGWTKVVTYFTDAPDWTAAGYLSHLNGPLSNFFAPMVGNPIIDYLNAFGLLLVGIAMLFGILVRWSSLCGALLMFLYWAADFPAEHSFIMDDHLIYLFVFVVLGTVEAGHTLGVDKYLEESGIVKKYPWLKIPMG